MFLYSHRFKAILKLTCAVKTDHSLGHLRLDLFGKLLLMLLHLFLVLLAAVVLIIHFKI